MKKAEAISILATSVRPREAKDRARYDEAVKMAIEALKSSERTAEASQTDHIADSDKKVERDDESAQNVKDGDLIFRQAAIDALHMHLMYRMGTDSNKKRLDDWINGLPSAQPEIIHCKECKYGVQDEVGRWFCRSLGCQIGNEDGSGYCADAERRTDERTD